MLGWYSSVLTSCLAFVFIDLYQCSRKVCGFLILDAVGGESFVPGVFSASVPVVRKVQCHYTRIALLLFKKARNTCCVKIKQLT